MPGRARGAGEAMKQVRAPVHLVLGDHAAGVLRAALGPSALLHTIPDDLGHGPLHDGAARLAWMRECHEGCFAWTHTETDAFAAWHALTAMLGEAPRDVVVWRAHNVSETVLLAMACWWLRDAGLRMLLVEPADGRHTGRHTEAELVALAASAHVLPDQKRAELAGLFERLRDDGGVRRAWRDGGVVTVPVAAFDELLIAVVGAQLTPARRVVADAMRIADPRDGLSDVFLGSRLMALIRDGRIEADRQPASLRDFAVRRGP